MITRITTGGVLNSYRYGLQRSSFSLYSAQNTALTGRNFHSFADNPSTAATSFRLRSSLAEAESQYKVGQSISQKYDVAWSSLETVINDVNNAAENSALDAILSGATDTSSEGRTALGVGLVQLSETIIQTMNVKYGDNFVFAGADGLDVPFSYDDAGKLCYRGIPVDTKDQDELATLKYLVDEEVKNADLGLGVQEVNGSVLSTSVVDVAMHGIYYLGYGVDEDGDPKNIASIINRMGELLQTCTDGDWTNKADEEEFSRLFGKFELAADTLTDKHIEMDTRAAYIKNNQEILNNKVYSMQVQVSQLEDVDEAEAISAFAWAQYCYNAALKVGNSVLSESLMDYLR